MKAITILHAVNSDSHPVVVLASNGKKYLVKLKGGLSSPLALINEWICLHMAKALDLPVIEPLLITLSEDTNCSAIDIEKRELLVKSLGRTIAFPYYENVKPFQLNSAELPVLNRLFLFDMFVLNMDRTDQNLNLISVNDSLRAIDFECTLLIAGIVNERKFLEDEKVMIQLRNHPFFADPLAKSELDKMFERLQMIDFDFIVNDMPKEWFAELPVTAEILIHGLKETTRCADEYWAFYLKMKSLTKELPESTLHRINTNRNNFIKSVMVRLAAN